jgi:hypothetical protein
MGKSRTVDANLMGFQVVVGDASVIASHIVDKMMLGAQLRLADSWHRYSYTVEPSGVWTMVWPDVVSDLLGSKRVRVEEHGGRRYGVLNG